MFDFKDTEEMHKNVIGIITAVLMYRLGVNEITIDMDDVKAVEHTFGGVVMDLLVKPDPYKKTVSFKIVAAK